MAHYHQYHKNISSVFSSDSEASVSESLENIEDMFLWYYMQNDVMSFFFQLHTSVLSVVSGF